MCRRRQTGPGADTWRTEWNIRVVIDSGLFALSCENTQLEFYNNNNSNVRLFWLRHNAQSTATSATQGGTRLYTEGLSSAILLPHTAYTVIDNRIGLTSWTLTRWRDQHTSDKVAHYSIYRPRKDVRLNWPSWLTYSGRLNHICGHPSATGRAWDRESSPALYRCATQPTMQTFMTHCFAVIGGLISHGQT